MTCQPNSVAVQTDKDGFLLDAASWNRDVADSMAETIPLQLSDEHWELIDFIRGYYLRFNHLPNTRMFVKIVQREMGAEKGNSRYLHQRFGDMPLKTLCRIAGLPKPPGCL